MSDDTSPAATTPARRRPRLKFWMLVVAGLGVGVLCGVGASMLVGSDATPTDRIVLESADEARRSEHAAASVEFLTAWRRYRYATYHTELVFERVATNGQSLRSSSAYTQQPPKRVVRDAESVMLSTPEASVTCNKVNGQFVCAPGPATAYDVDVESELEIWRTAFIGDTPYYLVSRPQPNCFQLDLAVVLVDPPYGEVTRLCFDAATGALQRRQVVRATATDTEEALTLSATIPPGAFDPPATLR